MDKCNGCTANYCYNCSYADELSAKREHKERLVKYAHRAGDLVHWLSYQEEVSASEKRELERMNAFLENLRDRIGMEDEE